MLLGGLHIIVTIMTTTVVTVTWLLVSRLLDLLQDMLMGGRGMPSRHLASAGIPAKLLFLHFYLLLILLLSLFLLL